MNAEQLWNDFVVKQKMPAETEYMAWAFGAAADKLAALVIKGTKTATASAYPLYEEGWEVLPKAGDYSVILNSCDEAVCIIQTTKIHIVPFAEVSAGHAAKEGEGGFVVGILAASAFCIF